MRSSSFPRTLILCVTVIMDPLFIEQIQQQYAQERDKRLRFRPEGSKQYNDIFRSSKFAHFQKDPWVDSDPPQPQADLKDGSRTKFLIIGAGYGGLMFAVRLVQAGFNVDDIRFSDYAGGFGGTWYWNRYPGLMCDIESYIFMPLLEETGYVPKHKYAHGDELREHANRIADKWNLKDKAWFYTHVTALRWDEKESEWLVAMTRKKGENQEDVTVRAQFVMSLAGVLNFPKLPGVPGIEDFKGHTFHTSRWDYEYTGGSSSDPALTNLKGKKVGIIGTGATAIQVVPELAKWAQELYVFQRTPSSVDMRGQHPTDKTKFHNEIATGKEWQRLRSLNFMEHLCNVSPAPSTNMVGDGWTYMPSYSALVGGPAARNIKNLEDIPKHVANLHALDLTRQESIRKRVDEIVQDKETAQKLKPWYPGWCKRPCFHDDYLPAFNMPHVHLVDTDGKGVDRIIKDGVVVDGVEYPLDLLIFSTGYRVSVTTAGLQVVGRGGRSLDEKWETEGMGTLHGVMTRGFPNLFLPSPSQAGAGANYTFSLDVLAIHIAYILNEASKRAKALGGRRFTVEPSEEGEKAWTGEILKRASAFAAMGGCTPGYLNREGETAQSSLEEKMKDARKAPWGEGVASFLDVIEEWRSEGKLSNVEVNVVE